MYDIIIAEAARRNDRRHLRRRSGKSVLLLEREGYGGQIAYAPRVENYPGVASVGGAELAERMLEQMLALDAETDVGEVLSVERTGENFTVRTEDGVYESRAVILATGAKHRHLGLPDEEELLGHGVSYCAVCDGGFYKNGVTAVVGGGDSALQEALLLSDICRTVYLIHRRDAFRGDAEKQARLFARKNVTVLTPMEIAGFLTEDGSLRALRLKNTATGEETELGVDCLFVSVGQQPELERFAALLPLTAQGYAAVPETRRNAVRGVFVARGLPRQARPPACHRRFGRGERRARGVPLS